MQSLATKAQTLKEAHGHQKKPKATHQLPGMNNSQHQEHLGSVRNMLPPPAPLTGSASPLFIFSSESHSLPL